MLKRIQITNMGPFESFDSGDLPTVVLIDGDNGVGKTGLQDCIKWVGESGHDPDILHGNAESGEVIITTDDDTQLRVRTTREDTWRGWKPAGGKRWIKGREEIEKIYRAIAYDPLAFLNLKPEKQMEMYAALSPAQATPEEITEAIGNAAPEAEGAKLLPSMSGLDRINTLRKAIYDARTTLNTGADTQEAHAIELGRTLPPPAPEGTDWNSEANRLRAEKEKLEDSEREAITAIANEFQNAKDLAAEAQRLAVEAIDKDINDRIKALEEERRNRREKAKANHDTVVEGARGEANQKAADIQHANAPAREKFTADLTTAELRAREQQEAKGTRKAIAAAEDGAAQKRTRAAILTESIKRLDALKVKVAERLPIPGARVEGGRIVREQDGGLVPLKRWNTADQWKFCLRFGMMLGGGFVCVDGINVFTDANQKALFETAKRYADERGVQFIFTKVRPEGGKMRVGAPPELVQ